MSLLPLLCFCCLLINFISTSSDVCKVVSVKYNIFQKGKRLNGFQYYQSTYVPDVLQCARMCFFRRRCRSFNYNENTAICEFNNARSDSPFPRLISSNDYLYSNIDDWHQAIGMGPCQNQPCGICEACYPTEYKYTCVKEEVTSCLDIKICTNTSTDGHYLVKPVMGTKPWLKVYCHDMNTNYPREYITLIHENFSLFPPIAFATCANISWTTLQPGVIFYKKIRLELFTLRVLTKDRTFTNVSCDPSLLGISDPLSFQNSGTTCSVRLDYGSAGDCMHFSCQPRKGIVQIDLRGTGLVVPPSMTWDFRGGAPSISSFYRSPSNEIINITCGGGCGWCFPKGDLYLEQKP